MCGIYIFKQILMLYAFNYIKYLTYYVYICFALSNRVSL